MHHWLKPMLPLKYAEASCFTCHTEKPDIKGGEKMQLGLAIIDKAGCNSCHQIESYPKQFDTGPDLTQISDKVSKMGTEMDSKSAKFLVQYMDATFF
jgi:cytochrome c2